MSSTVTHKPLKPGQHEVVRLLLAGLNLSDVSRASGIGRRTITRWVNHDARFIDALTQARQDHADAKAALRSIVTGGKASYARLKAALIVLGINEDELRESGNQAGPAKSAESKAMRKWLGDPTASVDGLTRS